MADNDPVSPPNEAKNQAEDTEFDDELSYKVRDRLEAFVPDLVRRTFAAGLGALFTTEEGLRRLSKEVPMPKEVAGYLASTANSTKDEVLRIIAREVREFLQTVNFSEEIAKMLTTLSFEVKTEIRFIPNSEKYAGVEPDVNAKVRLKRSEEKAGKKDRRAESESADDETSEKEPRRGWRRRRPTRGEGE